MLIPTVYMEREQGTFNILLIFQEKGELSLFSSPMTLDKLDINQLMLCPYGTAIISTSKILIHIKAKCQESKDYNVTFSSCLKQQTCIVNISLPLSHMWYRGILHCAAPILLVYESKDAMCVSSCVCVCFQVCERVVV